MPGDHAMLVTFDTPDEAQDAIKADALCRKIGTILKQNYPGRRWFVEVTVKGGMASIQCPSISMQYGYQLYLNKSPEDLEKAVKMAGGQILEMFRLSRERGAVGGEEAIQRDPRGEAVKAKTGL